MEIEVSVSTKVIEISGQNTCFKVFPATGDNNNTRIFPSISTVWEK